MRLLTTQQPPDEFATGILVTTTAACLSTGRQQRVKELRIQQTPYEAYVNVEVGTLAACGQAVLTSLRPLQINTESTQQRVLLLYVRAVVDAPDEELNKLLGRCRSLSIQDRVVDVLELVKADFLILCLQDEFGLPVLDHNQLYLAEHLCQGSFTWRGPKGPRSVQEFDEEF